MRIVDKLPKEETNLVVFCYDASKNSQVGSKNVINPARVNVAISKPAETIRQEAYLAYDKQKAPLVGYILKRMEYDSVIVFLQLKRIFL